MASVGIAKDGTAYVPYTPQSAALSIEDMEYIAGTLRQLLDQNPKGAIRRAQVMIQGQTADGSELELGCWLQAILPKLAPLKDVLLEFVGVPKDLNAMITTNIADMPKIRIRVTPNGVETLD
jgi:hypothetical protein